MNDALPVSGLDRFYRDTARELRRPFTPAAVKWKIQTNPKGDNGRALIVAYIDARLAAERLDAVCPGTWGTDFEEVTGGVLCRLTVGSVTRADVGWSDSRTTDMGLKGVYSDAFKRAAVHFGVGAFLYTLPRQYVAANELTKRERQGKEPAWFLPNKTLSTLASRYRQWLSETGVHHFGNPIEHGDPDDAPPPGVDSETGEIAGTNGSTPEPPKPVPEKRAEALFDLYKSSGVNPKTLALWLRANGSEDNLDPDSVDSLAKAISTLPKDKADALEAKLREKAEVAA